MPRKTFRLDHLLVAALLFAMALIAFVNILSRYFLHFSLAASEEITINLFVWMTVIGTGLAFERGAMLGMVTFFNMFPHRARVAMVILGAAASAALFVLVDYYMIEAIRDELTIYHATSGALGIPIWIYYAGVPVFSVVVFIGIVRGMRAQLRSL